MKCIRRNKTNDVLFDKNKTREWTHNHRVKKAEHRHAMQNSKQTPNTQYGAAPVNGCNVATPGLRHQQVLKSIKDLAYITYYNCKKMDYYSNKCPKPYETDDYYTQLLFNQWSKIVVL